eukprot:gene6101-8544_t
MKWIVTVAPLLVAALRAAGVAGAPDPPAAPAKAGPAERKEPGRRQCAMGPSC